MLVLLDCVTTHLTAMTTDGNSPLNHEPAKADSEIGKLVKSVKDSMSNALALLLMLVGLLFIVFIIGSI